MSSSPQLRRADRQLSEARVVEMLARGYCGRLATIGADGTPYVVPLLYVLLDGQVYVHNTSARGHLRENIDHNARACFEVDDRATSSLTGASSATPRSATVASSRSARCGSWRIAKRKRASARRSWRSTRRTYHRQHPAGRVGRLGTPRAARRIRRCRCAGSSAPTK